ncbi:MAG: hypothetical protein ACYSWU_08910 [Planctomycetota bacterium]|jgi:hypothetical protein
MREGSFSGRRRELEEKFFLERDRELLRALREEAASKERKKALADASGITVAALSLVPLVAVAWADGSLDVKERQAILAAAEQKGMQKKEHPGYQLLQRWLKRKPDPKLLAVWRGYVAALAQPLSEDARDTLKEDLLGRARAVAEAAGGLLGLGNKISKSEQATLSDLAQVFD